MTTSTRAVLQPSNGVEVSKHLTRLAQVFSGKTVTRNTAQVSLNQGAGLAIEADRSLCSAPSCEFPLS
jgi:hypothetical protein